MKTKDMFAALQPFAALSDIHRGDELNKFASAFAEGKDETVAARVKRIAGCWKKTSSQPNYPATLRKSFAAIQAGLSAMGANKQAEDFTALLSLCGGSSTGSIDGFVTQIAAALIAPAKTSKPRSKAAPAPKLPDPKLARELADQLAAAVLNPGVFAKVVDQLRDPKAVPTSTLHVIAAQFSGISKPFTGRKTPLEAIVRRHKEDMRRDAMGKALDRVGV